METTIVEFGKVKKMIGDDPAYLKDFCEAAVISFTEFKNNYETSMLDRDLEKLKRAGHKIKPAAQMIEVMQVVSEYEDAKKLLKNDGSDQEVQASVDRQKTTCDHIIGDFKKYIEQA